MGQRQERVQSQSVETLSKEDPSQKEEPAEPEVPFTKRKISDRSDQIGITVEFQKKIQKKEKGETHNQLSSR
jgi:hypothetical protein